MMKKKWPVFFDERIWLVNPESGFIGVATLWTPKEKVAPLMPTKVAAVGQLYSSAGIEFIFRNLWAKPQISTLVLCGRDATESGLALKEFFKKGTISRSKKIFGNQIPKGALDQFRQKVKLVDFCGETDLKKVARKVTRLKPTSPFAQKRKLFPLSKGPGVFPAEISVFKVSSPTIGLAWLKILKTILKFGWEIPRIYVYGGKERMVLNLAVVITKEEMAKPKVEPFLLFGKKEMKTYFKEFFKKERGDQGYTYGERLFDYFGLDQVSLMAKKLSQFPYNKGALATLWQPKVDNFPKRKPWRTPCLTLIQGLCQKEKLHLTAYFRANDMFNAWPLNAFALRQLQTILAKKIQKQSGTLTTLSHSAFIEEHDLPKAQKIVEKNDRLFCQWDPRGNLVISVKKNQILVKHFSPQGQLLQEFKQNGQAPKAAQKMAEKLAQAQVISHTEHALDIGEQLGKAEEAIKLGLKFEQDQNLKKK